MSARVNERAEHAGVIAVIVVVDRAIGGEAVQVAYIRQYQILVVTEAVVIEVFVAQLPVVAVLVDAIEGDLIGRRVDSCAGAHGVVAIVDVVGYTRRDAREVSGAIFYVRQALEVDPEAVAVVVLVAGLEPVAVLVDVAVDELSGVGVDVLGARGGVVAVVGVVCDVGLIAVGHLHEHVDAESIAILILVAQDLAVTVVVEAVVEDLGCGGVDGGLVVVTVIGV